MQLRTQRSIDNYVGRIAIALLRPATKVLGALLRRNHQLTIGREVVWMKMLGGGSLLLAMPMLLGFRRAHPGVRMVLITTPGVRPFAELMGVFDEYRIIDVRGAGAVVSSAIRVLGQTLRTDCIVDLEVHSRLTTVFTTVSDGLTARCRRQVIVTKVIYYILWRIYPSEAARARGLMNARPWSKSIENIHGRPCS